MPKITQGGVSDVNVEAGYIAPPGVAPQIAIDAGTPSAGEIEGQDLPAENVSASAPSDGPSETKKAAPAKKIAAAKK